MSGGHLCKAEAQTEAAAENSIPLIFSNFSCFYGRAQRPSPTTSNAYSDKIKRRTHWRSLL